MFSLLQLRYPNDKEFIATYLIEILALPKIIFYTHFLEVLVCSHISPFKHNIDLIWTFGSFSKRIIFQNIV